MTKQAFYDVSVFSGTILTDVMEELSVIIFRDKRSKTRNLLGWFFPARWRLYALQKSIYQLIRRNFPEGLNV
jgi:hypothetical protein